VDTQKHPPTTGFVFELADFATILGWSEARNLRMVAELDYCANGEGYEEVLAFYARNCAFRRWMMCRTREDIVVQPTIGHTTSFASVAEALEYLTPVADERCNLCRGRDQHQCWATDRGTPSASIAGQRTDLPEAGPLDRDGANQRKNAARMT
jgi:hypothetical protein